MQFDDAAPFEVQDGPEWISADPAVVDVDFTPDAKTVLVWLTNGNVALLDADNGREIVRLPVGASPSLPFHCVSYDSRMLLVSEPSGQIGVWDLADRKKLRSLPGHEGGVWCLAISADPRLAVSSGADGCIRLWNVEQGIEIASQSGNANGPPRYVWFNAATTRIYWVRGEGLLGRSELHDLQSQESILQTDAPVIAVSSIAFGQRSTILTLSGGDALLVRPDPQSPDLNKPRMTGHKRYLPFGGFCLAAPAPGDHLFAVYAGGKSYEVRRNWGYSELAGRSDGDQTKVAAIALAADGRRAVSAYPDGRVRVFRLPSPHSPADSPYVDFREQVQRARSASDIDQLEALASAARNEPRNQRLNLTKWSVFLEMVAAPDAQTDASWEKLIGLLKAWQTAYPKSIAAHVALAQAWIKFAWRARGDAPAVLVERPRAQEFDERIQEARAVIQAGAKLEQKSASLYTNWITVSMAQGGGWDETKRLVDEGAAIDPIDFPLYDHAATSLLRRWGGMPGDVARLANHSLQQHGDFDGLYAYAALAQTYACYEGALALFSEGFDLATLQKAARALRERSPDDPYLRDFPFFVACIADDHQEASRCVQSIRAGNFTQLWQSDKILGRYVAWARRPLERSKPLQSTLVAFGGVQNFAYSPADVRLITSGCECDQSCRSWDANTLRMLGVKSSVPFTRFVLSSDGDALLGSVETQDGAVFARTDRGAGGLRPLARTSKPLAAWDISRDGRQLAVGHRDGSIAIYSLATGAAADGFNPVFSERIAQIGQSDDGRRIVVAGTAGRCAIYDATDEREVRDIEKIASHSHCLTTGGGRIALACRDTIKICGFDGSLQAELVDPAETGAKTYYAAVAFSHDQKLLAAAAAKRSGQSRNLRHEVQVWDLESGKVVASFDYHFDFIRHLAFTANDNGLISAGDDGYAALWDISSHRQAD